MGNFGKSRLRKNISIVAALVLFLNSIMPTVPVFATGDEQNGDSTPSCESGYHLNDLDECVADEPAPEQEPETPAQEPADPIYCTQDSESLPANAEYVVAEVKADNTPCEWKCNEGYEESDKKCVEKVAEPEEPKEQEELKEEEPVQTRGGGAKGPISCEGKAKIGDECYDTLQVAVLAAEAGATIELSAGTYGLDKVSFTKDVTIKGTDGVIIQGPKVCTDGNSNHISDGNAKAGTIDPNVTVTFEDVILDLGDGNCAGQGFAGNEGNSKVIIKDSIVKGRLTTFTNMKFDTVTFSNTPSYNVDVHKGSDVEFTGCTFSGTNRNINVYDWNNDGSADHGVTFTNCTFKTSSNTANKGAINIHESHANQAYAVKYNVTVTDANIKEGTYPDNKEVIWYESKEGNGKGYFSKIVAADGLVSIDDIRRVIQTAGGEIKVTVKKGEDTVYSYSTPARATAAGEAADTAEELEAIQNWYTSNGYKLTEIPGDGEEKYSISLATYTITWTNKDDSTIDTTTVAHGVLPTHDNATYTEEGYIYTFAGWTPEIVAATAATTYKATYTWSCDTANNYHPASNEAGAACVQSVSMACTDGDDGNANYTHANGNATWDETLNAGAGGWKAPTCAFESCKNGYTQVDGICRQDCDFNGTKVVYGQSITAYSTSSVICPSTCASEQRTCGENGVLGGTYTNSTCEYEPNDTSDYSLSKCPDHGICTSITPYTVNNNACVAGQLLYQLDGCEGGYHEWADACVENSNTDNCSGQIPQHAVAKAGHGTFAQTWVNDAWNPLTKAWTYDADECGFTCEEGYHDNGNNNCVINQYTVTFMDGDTPLSSLTITNVSHGSTVERPDSPTKAGVRFAGWYTEQEGGSLFDFSSIITSDKVLYAHWVDTVDEINTKATAIYNTYYDKVSNTNGGNKQYITDINEDIYYEEIGDYKLAQNPDTITIGTTSYNAEDTTLSIGQNVFIKKPVFKVSNGKLYVAVPWLIAESLPGTTTTIEARTETYSVQVFGANATNQLTLSEAGAPTEYTRAGERNEVSMNGTTVTIKSSDGRQAFGLKIKDGDTEISNASQYVYRLSSDGSMGITVPEYGYTYTKYPSYKNGLYTSTDTAKTDNVKLALPGKGAVTVTFNFTPVYRVGTVTFNVGEGEVTNAPEAQLIWSDSTTATRPATNPSKEGHGFANWYTTSDGDTLFDFDGAIAGDTYVYAHWTTNTYTITWVDGNGETIYTEEVAYGETPEYDTETHGTPTKTATDQYTYTFTDWDNAPAEVTAAATYTATFTPVKRSYTITFVDAGGTTTEDVEYGVTPSHVIAVKTSDGTCDLYAAGTWDTAIVPVVGEATYTAEYNCTTKHKYTITWKFKNAQGEEQTETQEVEYNGGAGFALSSSLQTVTVNHRVYTFASWTPAVVAVTADATYTATYIETCEEGYGDVNGSCLNEQTVACTQSGAPANASYTAGNVTVNYVNGEWETAANCAWTCDDTYHPDGNSCVTSKLMTCTTLDPNAIYTTTGTTGAAMWDGSAWIAPSCAVTTCVSGYSLTNGVCERVEPSVPTSELLVDAGTGTATLSGSNESLGSVEFIEVLDSTGDILTGAQDKIVLVQSDDIADMPAGDTTEANLENNVSKDLVTDTTKKADVQAVLDLTFLRVPKVGAISEINSSVKFSKPIKLTFKTTKSVKIGAKHHGDNAYGLRGLTLNPNADCNNPTAVVWYTGGLLAPLAGIVEIYTCEASSFVAYSEENVSTPSGGGSSGGGSTSYSCKNLPNNAVANNTSKPSKTTEYTYSTDTGAVCTFQCKTGYVRNETSGTCDLSESTPTTGDNAEVNTGSTNENPDNVNATSPAYDDELVNAYNWAHKLGITTMPTIQEAMLYDGITREQLAKMMVVFTSKVLGKQPVRSDVPKYRDVSAKTRGAELANYVTLAYQYQIMGINADGTPLQYFNPSGKVSRAEFATVLSRVLFGSKYNTEGDNFWTKHIKALEESGILTNTDPNIQELRGWILLMLYRANGGLSKNDTSSSTSEVEEIVNSETSSEEASDQEVKKSDEDTQASSDETSSEESN